MVKQYTLTEEEWNEYMFLKSTQKKKSDEDKCKYCGTTFRTVRQCSQMCMAR